MAGLDSILRPRGLHGVESGGNGHCLFTSVIASIKHAAFLPANSPLLPLLSVSRRGCPALRDKIAETFLASPYYVHYLIITEIPLMMQPGGDIFDPSAIMVLETNGASMQSLTSLSAMFISTLG